MTSSHDCFTELVRGRRTIHEFDSTAEVSWTLVSQALNHSLWALNHRLTFPWRYFRLGPQARARVAELALAVYLEEKSLTKISAVLEAQIKNKVLDPSELIVLGLKRNTKPEVAREDYATLSASVMIASLSLWQHQIGSKWSTGKVSRSPGLYEILSCDKDEVELCGFLFVGKQSQVPRDQSRPPLSEFLTETL